MTIDVHFFLKKVSFKTVCRLLFFSFRLEENLNGSKSGQLSGHWKSSMRSILKTLENQCVKLGWYLGMLAWMYMAVFFFVSYPRISDFQIYKQSNTFEFFKFAFKFYYRVCNSRQSWILSTRANSSSSQLIHLTEV